MYQRKAHHLIQAHFPVNYCQVRRRKNMKVFDFDNTLYRGESAADLFFFMIKRNRKLKNTFPSSS